MRRLARNARVDFMQTRLLLARAVQAGLSEEDATAVQAIANGVEVNAYMLRLAGQIDSEE